jgi:CRP-like cAMP-binding protein
MILEKMSVIFHKPGEMVTTQSQFNDKICFLSNGFIDVQKTFDFVEQYYIQTYVKGQMFGEVSAVLGCRSDVTTVCKNYCKIGMLRTNDYESIVFKYPTLRMKMNKQIKTHLSNPVNSFFLHHYQRSSVLTGLTKEDARQVSFHCFLTKVMTH